MPEDDPEKVAAINEALRVFSETKQESSGLTINLNERFRVPIAQLLDELHQSKSFVKLPLIINGFGMGEFVLHKVPNFRRSDLDLKNVNFPAGPIGDRNPIHIYISINNVPAEQLDSFQVSLINQQKEYRAITDYDSVVL